MCKYHNLDPELDDVKSICYKIYLTPLIKKTDWIKTDKTTVRHNYNIILDRNLKRTDDMMLRCSKFIISL